MLNTHASLQGRCLIAPQQLKRQQPVSPVINNQITACRLALREEIEAGEGPLWIIAGPCSVHDEAATLDYARRLVSLQQQLGSSVRLIMRVYVEKPRTCLGWKGMVYDPQRDGQVDMNEGLSRSRQLMLAVAALGLPLATEALNPMLVPYFNDLISWYALGARTTESQTHREMASGLPGVIGFKNATDGGLDVAIHAMRAAAYPQVVTRINEQGQLEEGLMPGNAFSHLVLRGGHSGPNYDETSLLAASERLQTASLNPRVVVDASHANCGKVAERQVDVLKNLATQLRQGAPLLGVMLESFIHSGQQPLQAGEGQYGVSMTDPCLGWEATEEALQHLAQSARIARQSLVTN